VTDTPGHGRATKIRWFEESELEGRIARARAGARGRPNRARSYTRLGGGLHAPQRRFSMSSMVTPSESRV